MRIWDPVTGQQRWFFAGGHAGGVIGLAVAPDGTWLATTNSRDGLVRIWEPVTGQQRGVFGGHAGGVDGLAVAPDGTWLATIGRYDGSVRIWDPATSRASAVMRVDSRLSACSWDLTGHLLAVAGQDGLYLFTFNSGI